MRLFMLYLPHHHRLFLPDKSYYEAEKKAQHDQLLQLWSSMVEALMDKLGYSKRRSKRLLMMQSNSMPFLRQM